MNKDDQSVTMGGYYHPIESIGMSLYHVLAEKNPEDLPDFFLLEVCIKSHSCVSDFKLPLLPLSGIKGHLFTSNVCPIFRPQ